MSSVSRPFLVSTLTALLLKPRLHYVTLRIEAAGRPMTGLGVWRSTLCAGTAVPCAQQHRSSVAAFIPRTKAAKRMALSAPKA
jgi:hypothetical protein